MPIPALTFYHVRGIINPDADVVEWQTLGGAGGYMQKGTVSVIVRLAVDCYDDTHYTSGTADKAAGRMERAKEVDALLQMYKPECCQTPLVRKRSRFHTMPRGIKVYETHYECTVWDNAVSR